MNLTIEKICKSLEHGNEIEFQYQGKFYSLLPNWVDNSIVGYCIGEMYGEYYNVDSIQLKNFLVGEMKFEDIVDKIEIIDSSIPM